MSHQTVDPAWRDSSPEAAAILWARAPDCPFTTRTVLRQPTWRGVHLVVAERRR